MFNLALAYVKVHLARGTAFATVGLASPTIREVLSDNADRQQESNPEMPRAIALAIPTTAYMGLGALAGPFTALVVGGVFMNDLKEFLETNSEARPGPVLDRR